HDLSHHSRYHRLLRSSPTRRSSDLLESGIKKIVYTSTAGVIGPSYDEPSTEESIREIDFFNEYEGSKSLSENWVLSYLSKGLEPDRKSTRLNSSHVKISYAVFCLKK